MEITIPLPENTSSLGSYKALQGYLKQLELAIHHAQKAVQNAEETGIEITEDCFAEFLHPSLINGVEDNLDVKDITPKIFEDNLWEYLQLVELHINIH